MTIFKPVVRLLMFSALLGDALVWAGDWPVYRHDALGTSNANETLTASDARTLGVKWRASMPYGAIANPIVVGDTVYATGGNGYLRAINAATGAERWSYSSRLPGAPPPLQSPQWGRRLLRKVGKCQSSCGSGCPLDCCTSDFGRTAEEEAARQCRSRLIKVKRDRGARWARARGGGKSLRGRGTHVQRGGTDGQPDCCSDRLRIVRGVRTKPWKWGTRA